MKTAIRLTPELVVLASLLVLACLGLIFMDALVASAKVLFGRSMTAIGPALFPRIVLTLTALLSAGLLAARLGGASDTPSAPRELRGWQRGVAFFALMTLYALTMETLGFLISSAIAVTLMAWLTGNRSMPQIAAMALVAPVALYLGATRLLVVSLPELDAIELAFARLLGG